MTLMTRLKILDKGKVSEGDAELVVIWRDSTICHNQRAFFLHCERYSLERHAIQLHTFVIWMLNLDFIAAHMKLIICNRADRALIDATSATLLAIDTRTDLTALGFRGV